MADDAMPTSPLWNRLLRRSIPPAHQEKWRPPPHSSSRTAASRLSAAIRRFFDLQAGSIWSDLAAVLPFVDGMILDIGCGAQPYRRLFGANARYIGLDTSDSLANFGYSMPDTVYFSGTPWPVSDASADFVLCTETLEHVSDPQAFLAEVARCLRPAGTLLLTVPFAARWHFIPHDYWRFTPTALRRLLATARLDDIVVYARGNELTVACYKTMALVLPLLMPQVSGAFYRWFLRLLALPLVPIFLLLAIVANVSLRGQGGDDCLGYTVLARKPGP